MDDDNTRLIPLGKSGKFAIVDADDYEWLMRWKWFYTIHGYANRVTNRGRKNWINIPMHRAIMNPDEGTTVDHINRNKLDNRKCNLRICTQAQNHWNRPISIRNTSGFKGVSWQARDNKWLSLITVNGKRKQLGLFECKYEAAKVYNLAVEEYFGEYGFKNDIPTEYL